jgi:hypothetical protein
MQDPWIANNHQARASLPPGGSDRNVAADGKMHIAEPIREHGKQNSKAGTKWRMI